LYKSVWKSKNAFVLNLFLYCHDRVW